MSIALLQQALAALENPALPVYTTLRKEIRMALAAPQPEPVAWRIKPMVSQLFWQLSDDGYYASCKRDQGYIVENLYAAPPAAPAPAVCDGGTCGLGGYCANCPRQSAAPARPDEFTCPYCFDQGAAPVVPDIANPITDEQIIEAASNWDCGTRHENEEWAFKRPRELLQFARAVLALSAAPVVREPLKPWEFVAMWATAAKKHTDTYDTAVEFGRAVEAHHGITGGGK